MTVYSSVLPHYSVLYSHIHNVYCEMPNSAHWNTSNTERIAEENPFYIIPQLEIDGRNLIMSALFSLRWDSKGKDLSFGGYLFSGNNKSRFSLIDMNYTELLNTTILLINNSFLLSSQLLLDNCNFSLLIMIFVPIFALF